MAGKKRSRQRPLSDDERALWDEVTKSIRRAATTAALPVVPTPNDPGTDETPPPPVSRRAAGRRPAPPPPAAPPLPSVIPEMTHGAAPGMDRRTQQRLRRGKVDIEARLDLHGHTQMDAHRALESFLSACFHAERRTVLVITGKGSRLEGRTGVLKAAVPQWLNESPMRQWVTGFSYAAPKDGGDGALYIRIKRRRSPAP